MRRLVEPLKTLTIVALLVLTFFLFFRIWMYDDSGIPQGLARLFGMPEAVASDLQPSRAETYGGAVSPVAAAILNHSGLHGTRLSDDASAALYGRLSPLISEALGAASEPQRAVRALWEQSLEQVGLGFYVEFSDPQPLSLFALSQGVVYGDDNIWIDRVMFIEDDGDGVAMLLFAGRDGGFYTASTVSLSSSLSSLAEGFLPNGYRFIVSETREMLYAEGAPSVGTLTATVAAAGESLFTTLLESFSMNPLTNYRYTNAVGTQFAVEDTKNLTLSAGGELVYSNPDATGTANTLNAAIEHCRRLAVQAIAPLSGDASPSLRSAYATDDGFVVTFGYVAGGASIYTDGNSSSFYFEIQNGGVASARFTLRRYQFDGGDQLLMPPKHAVATGAQRIAYFDTVGTVGGSVVATWSAE